MRPHLTTSENKGQSPQRAHSAQDPGLTLLLPLPHVLLLLLLTYRPTPTPPTPPTQDPQLPQEERPGLISLCLALIISCEARLILGVIRFYQVTA